MGKSTIPKSESKNRMSVKWMKRLIWGAIAITAFSFLLDRPLPTRGSDAGENLIQSHPPEIIQQEGGTDEPEATAEPSASGEEVVSESASQTVAVGIYVISIDELNLAESYYVMTFYLSMTCLTPACNPEGFEFTNGTIQYMDLLYTEPYYSYKAQVLFRENFDVQRFPFDSHVLDVSIEDAARDNQSLVYVADENLTAVDPNVVISGWDLNPTSQVTVDDHFYPTFDQSYSRYLFRLEISRPWLSTIFKALLPITFILMVGYSLLWLGIDRASEFLEMTSNGLVGAILHHLYLSSLIPPTGYMTLMDAFMSVSYLALVVILFILIRVTTYVDKGDTEAATRVHSLSLWLVPLILIALQGSVFLLWFFVF